MNIIYLTDSVESTEDCKEQLNIHVGAKKWKRLYKIGDIRCFTNEDNEFVTVAEGSHAIFETEGEYAGEYDDTEIEYCLFIGLNIQEEIKAIKEVAKMYYTSCDYGELFYNPYTKAIHVVAGDGGYCYEPNKLKRNKYGDIDFDSYENNFKEFNTHPQTTFIQKVTWEDEYFPEESGFILVGKIKELDY